MVDILRLYEIRADQTSPLLKLFTVAKAGHMVVNAVPADDEGITGRLFDRPLELHRLATPCPLKQRNSLLDARFELLFLAWLDQNLCNFKYHSADHL